MADNLKERFPETSKLHKFYSRKRTIENFVLWIQKRGFDIIKIADNESKFSLPEGNLSIEDLIDGHYGIDIKALKIEKEAVRNNFIK